MFSPMDISSSSDFEYDEDLLHELCSMGLSVDACKKALYYTRNIGIDRALKWILEHMNDADFNEPFNPPGVKNIPDLKAHTETITIATNPDLKADLEAIATNHDLKADPVAMESTPVQADKALEKTLEFLTAENEDLQKQLKLQESRHASDEREWDRWRPTGTRKLENKIVLDTLTQIFLRFHLKLKFFTAVFEDLRKKVSVPHRNVPSSHATQERQSDVRKAQISARIVLEEFTRLKNKDISRFVDWIFDPTEEIDFPATLLVTANYRDKSGNFQYNKDRLDELCGMGFSLASCKRTLYYTRNCGIFSGLEWVLEHMTDADFNEPFNPPCVKKNNPDLKEHPETIATNPDLKAGPEAIATNRDLKADPEAIATTVAMGSTPVQGDKDVEKTLEFLTAENEVLREQWKIKESGHVSKALQFVRETRKLESEIFYESLVQLLFRFQCKLKSLAAENERLQNKLKVQKSSHVIQERQLDVQRAEMKIRKLLEHFSQLKNKDIGRYVDLILGRTEKLGTGSPAAEASPVTANYRDAYERLNAFWSGLNERKEEGKVGDQLSSGIRKEGEPVTSLYSELNSFINNAIPYDAKILDAFDVKYDYIQGPNKQQYTKPQHHSPSYSNGRNFSNTSQDLVEEQSSSGSRVHNTSTSENKVNSARNFCNKRKFQHIYNSISDYGDYRSVATQTDTAGCDKIGNGSYVDGSDEENEEMLPADVSQSSSTTEPAKVSTYYDNILSDYFCRMKRSVEWADETAFRKQLKADVSGFTKCSAELQHESTPSWIISWLERDDPETAILKQIAADHAARIAPVTKTGRGDVL